MLRVLAKIGLQSRGERESVVLLRTSAAVMSPYHADYISSINEVKQWLSYKVTTQAHESRQRRAATGLAANNSR